MADLVRRPQIKYSELALFDPERPHLSREIAEEVELEIKYAGYISKQLEQIGQMKNLEDVKLPIDADYSQIKGIRLEAAEKLDKIRYHLDRHRESREFPPQISPCFRFGSDREVISDAAGV